MLPELVESKAQGEIADIYAQIRSTCAVPYVSSLQRHLATRPGWLEWAWAAVAPAFRSGMGPSAAWKAADALTVPRQLATPCASVRRCTAARDGVHKRTTLMTSKTTKTSA